MRLKPSNLLYDVDEKPPFHISIVLGIQHISVFFVGLIFPVAIIHLLGDSIDAVTARGYVSLTMISGAIITVLQAMKKTFVGSGYLIPSVAGPSYLSASMIAATVGGLPLIMGMTAFVGVIEMLFSRIMHKIRFLFPPEVTGVIVMMVGIVVVPLTMKSFYGLSPGMTQINTSSVIVGLITLGTMIILNLYGSKQLKLYTVLIGMAVGYILSYFFNLYEPVAIEKFQNTPVFAFPRITGWHLAFDIKLMIPFTVAAICSTFKTIGDITTTQKANDANWKRTDMTSVSGGILADGLGGLVPGLLGGFGQSTSSSNIGLSIATGSTSRIIALFFGVILTIIAFLPKVAEVFLLMPKPVIGATLIYCVAFMIVTGMQIITSRMLDARKIFVVGISIIVGLSHFFLKDIYDQFHSFIRPVFASSLSLATVTALVLNTLLRFGTKNRQSVTLKPNDDFATKMLQFLDEKGGLWGAPPAIIHKIGSALIEFNEIFIGTNIMDEEEVTIGFVYDEFFIDVYINYTGKRIEFNRKMPTPDEILKEDGTIKLATFMFRKYPDKIKAISKGNQQQIKLHFDN
ncbi:MAG: uracil-xanthine permease family protein [Fidelibacterota bacterium]